MSVATPFWILAVALAGSVALGVTEGVLDRRGSPLALARRGLTELRRPLAAPEVKDVWLYHGAPPLLLASAVLALAMVPWSPGFRGLDFETGAILYSAALAYVAPAVLMAGWGSGRPLAVVGGFRFVALMLAYEMPVVMAVTAAGTPAESLRPAAIVEAQDTVPLALSQPLAFVLFLPSVLAIAFVPPFDLPQAPGELGGGAFASYSGPPAAVLWLAQRVLVLGAAGMTAALFLGGWNGPLLPGWLWMALKTAAVALVALYAGRRLPRVEIDRLLAFAWKVPVPLAIVAILWAGVTTLLFYE